MIEAITAIALLCQVNGTYASSNYLERKTYDSAKASQIQCQQALIKCLTKLGLKQNEYQLDVCILKGEY